jgi:signal transduction histidine kinase
VVLGVRATPDGSTLWEVQDAGEGTSDGPLSDRAPSSGGVRPSGLGVAFPAAIIEKHGGVLRFESAPGVGTTASIWLPARA